MFGIGTDNLFPQVLGQLQLDLNRERNQDIMSPFSTERIVSVNTQARLVLYLPLDEIGQ